MHPQSKREREPWFNETPAWSKSKQISPYMVRHSTVAYVIVATCAKFVYYSHGRSGESQRLMEKGDPVPSLTHKDCLLIRFSSSPFRNAQAMTSVFYNNGVKAPGGREDKKEKRKKKKLMKWDTTVVGEWQKQLRVFLFISQSLSCLPCSD